MRLPEIGLARLDVGWFDLALSAGSRPAARYFLLLRQKKVPKEKATPLPATLRVAKGNLRWSF